MAPRTTQTICQETEHTWTKYMVNRNKGRNKTKAGSGELNMTHQGCNLQNETKLNEKPKHGHYSSQKILYSSKTLRNPFYTVCTSRG